MSNAALRWAFPMRIEGPTKAVLIALAEHADDDGACWPSIARLVQFSGVQERRVRLALRELEVAGLISVETQTGRNSRFTIDLTSAWDAGANKVRVAKRAASPRHAMPDSEACDAGSGTETPACDAEVDIDTPACDAGHPGMPCSDPGMPCSQPRHGMPPNPKEPSITPNEPSLAAQPIATEVPAKPKRTKARSSLPDGWQPSAAGFDFADEQGADAKTELPRFANYHLGKGSLMADWDAAWRTWCLNAKQFSRAVSRSPPSQTVDRFAWLDEPTPAAPKFDLEMTQDEHGTFRPN